MLFVKLLSALLVWLSGVGWIFTNGVTSGTVAMPPLRFGTQQVRAFFNDGFVMEGSSATFMVSTAIGTDKSTYTSADQVTVNFGGMLGASKDWVAVTPAGSPPGVFSAFFYTGGAAGGSHVWPASTFGAGTFVARSLFNDTTTVSAESAPFTITP